MVFFFNNLIVFLISIKYLFDWYY